MWLGKGKHFLTFPLRSGELINYVGFVPADEEMRESWSAPGDPDALRREFAGWDPRIETLLSEVLDAWFAGEPSSDESDAANVRHLGEIESERSGEA